MVEFVLQIRHVIVLVFIMRDVKTPARSRNVLEKSVFTNNNGLTRNA
jgi:hypothetical protein